MEAPREYGVNVQMLFHLSGTLECVMWSALGLVAFPFPAPEETGTHLATRWLGRFRGDSNPLPLQREHRALNTLLLICLFMRSLHIRKLHLRHPPCSLKYKCHKKKTHYEFHFRKSTIKWNFGMELYIFKQPEGCRKLFLRDGKLLSKLSK